MKTSAALLVLAAATAIAQAQPPVVTVIESSAPGLWPEAVRAALRQAGLPVLSLAEAGAGSSADVLTVAIARDGRRATVRLRTSGGVHVLVLQGEPSAPLEAWLARPVAALVRAHQGGPARRRRVIDPWEDAPPPRGASPPRPTGDTGAPAPHGAPASPDHQRDAAGHAPIVREVIDPWAPKTTDGHAGRTGYAIREVLDPWGEADTSRPASAEVSALAELVDPWERATIEGAAALSAPPRSRR